MINYRKFLEMSITSLKGFHHIVDMCDFIRELPYVVVSALDSCLVVQGSNLASYQQLWHNIFCSEYWD